MRPNLVALDVTPGLVQDETGFKVRQGGYTSINNMRPHRGGLETIGGWEFLTTDQLTGVCRGIHCWRDNSGEINFAFGTHSKLYVWTGGGLYDITPADFVAGNENGFGGGGHGVGTFGTSTFGAVSEGVYFPLTWSLDNFGEWLIANPRGGKIYVWKNDITALATELAGRTSIYDADFTSYADQTAFDVDYTRGTGWTFDAANDEADCDGAQTGDSDLEYTVSGLTVGERYRVEFTFTRTAGALSAVGNTSVGTASSEASGTVAVVFIATGASHDVKCRGNADFIGTVTDVTVDQMGAPEIVESILVTPSRQIVAYGCEEELGVTQNPRAVRWCDIGDPTDWTTAADNNAGEDILTDAGKLIRAKKVGSIICIWSDSRITWQQYVGLPGQTWAFNTVGDNCGAIGPNSMDVLGSTAYWCAPQFRFFTVGFGGEPVQIPSPIDQTFEDARVHAQQEKIYCSTNSKYGEVWWWYPADEDGTNECSRYYALATQGADAGQWFAGQLARTAMIDAGPYEYPVAVGADNYVYIHERGVTAAGDAISWHAETGDIYLNESSQVVQVRGMRPDIHDQRGAVTFTLKTKQYPQGDETSHTPQTLVASQDKSDFRASGAIVKLRWESELVGATCRLGRPVFDVVERGRR